MALPRLLLVFPAQSYRVEAYVAAARRAGVELVLATDLPAPFARHGLEVHEADLARPERAAEALAGAAGLLHGVVATNETSAVVAALVAERRGLPHATADAAYAARDKRLMRERLSAHGVPGPRFRSLEPHHDAAHVAALVRFPCVVKPPMLTGSQGVIRADDHAELASALARTRRILARHPSAASALPEFHRVLVEDYLEGPEVAVEALMTEGALEPIAIFDKPDELSGPFFEETLYVTPSRLAGARQAAVLEVTERAARALGLRHGPIHAELRVGPDGPAIVEIAGRSIGGLCSRVLEAVAGSLEELVLRHAAGLARRRAEDGAAAAAGVMMLPIPRSGVLRAVRGVERARAVAGIEGVTIAVQPGESIRALPEGASYLGFLFARGDSPAGVERSLREAHAALELDLAPLLT